MITMLRRISKSCESSLKKFQFELRAPSRGNIASFMTVRSIMATKDTKSGIVGRQFFLNAFHLFITRNIAHNAVNRSRRYFVIYFTRKIQ